MVKSVQDRGLGGSQAAVAPVPRPPDASPATSEARATSAAETPGRTRLINVLRKRLRRLGTLLAEVLGEQTPEAVHDLRVWSRRVQQTLAALFPGSRSRRLRSLRRTLRRSRRALGAWRNRDVVLQRLARKQRQTRSAEKQRAWALVIDSVRKRRRREVRRARRRLVRLDLFDLAEEVEALLKAPGASGDGASASPHDIVAAARAQWQAALSRALEDRRVENIHGFRIQTKRLRYRIELLRDLGTGIPRRRSNGFDRFRTRWAAGTIASNSGDASPRRWRRPKPCTISRGRRLCCLRNLKKRTGSRPRSWTD